MPRPQRGCTRSATPSMTRTNSVERRFQSYSRSATLCPLAPIWRRNSGSASNFKIASVDSKITKVPGLEVSGHRGHHSPQGPPGRAHHQQTVASGRKITMVRARRSSLASAVATKPRPSISTTSESATSSMCERPWLRKPVRVGCVPPARFLDEDFSLPSRRSAGALPVTAMGIRWPRAQVYDIRLLCLTRKIAVRRVPHRRAHPGPR